MYIIVNENNKIVSVFEGDINNPPNPILETDTVHEVSDAFIVRDQRYMDIRMFDSGFNPRPSDELVAEGLLAIGEDEKIVNGVIVKLNGAEKAEKGLIDKNEFILNFKTRKFEEISVAYSNEFINGHFHSEALGIDIDYRRNTTKNDLQNVDVLIEVMKDEGSTETEFKGYRDQKTIATLTQIKAMRKEMLYYSTALYGKKESLEATIKAATTIAELENIRW